MKINRQGISRIVIELKSIVIKIPNPSYTWLHFLNGLLANISEAATYKHCNRKDLLCPVLWASWGGWIVIMAKAYPLDDLDYIDYSEWINTGLGGDDKPDNYGYYKNRLVKIDYGN